MHLKLNRFDKVTQRIKKSCPPDMKLFQVREAMARLCGYRDYYHIKNAEDRFRGIKREPLGDLVKGIGELTSLSDEEVIDLLRWNHFLSFDPKPRIRS